MTFQRKLLLACSLMALPTVLVGAAAIRSNILERRALEALGRSMARTRTYAELETAMFNQSDVVWRYLSGMDPTARDEFLVSGEVVDHWQRRWRAELRPEELHLSDSVQALQHEIRAVAGRVFALYDAGERDAAFQLARRAFRDQLLPELTRLNRETYRQARESSVRGAYSRLEDILVGEGGVLVALSVLALAAGLFASWFIARGLARPIKDLTQAMAVVGTGELDYPIAVSSRDEIGQVARAFAEMTVHLRQSRADMLRLNAELEAKIAQLERTQGQLIQSEKLASIGEMAAAVAHGLRNPLASLRATAQLALRRPGSPASAEHLALIVQEVDRLDRRINHLLNFSRPAPFNPRPASVTELVDDLLPTFAELLSERRIEVRREPRGEVPEVRVDPMQIEQALVEVVSNALDAMPRGGQLRVGVRCEPGARDVVPTVVVEIEDTGGGIPAHLLPSVCEPFFTTRPAGTGLGLAIARRYVEQNGGRLEIESRAGAGTVVRVRLPAAASSTSPPMMPPAAAAAPTTPDARVV